MVIALWLMALGSRLMAHRLIRLMAGRELEENWRRTGGELQENWKGTGWGTGGELEEN